ncbi:MAG: tRNA (guanosine(37)-N1)-methyltransferase TrmD [Candidatus Omnitrophota bacterium]
MRIDILTIFPKMFQPVLGESILKRAQKKGLARIYIHDLRDYSHDRHRKVDDRPFGGGSGMVMRPEPIFEAAEAILPKVKQQRKKTRVILLSPKGRRLEQRQAKRLSRYRQVVLICGHYEGVDERVRQHLIDEEVSIGDYVLTGGELPAMVLVDCILRLLPGVLGDKNSLNSETFEGNLLEYPQYTRPANYRKMKVPAVLLSGNHKTIAEWRKRQAILRTRQDRPDLLNGS